MVNTESIDGPNTPESVLLEALSDSLDAWAKIKRDPFKNLFLSRLEAVRLISKNDFPFKS